VPTQEENKASFRRYLEEAWNQSNLEVVDEIFDRYISHQPDGSVLELASRTQSTLWASSVLPSLTYASSLGSSSQKVTRWFPAERFEAPIRVSSGV
jgi:hypothetical protein